MRARHLFRGALLACCVLMAAPAGADEQAHDPHAHHKKMMKEAASEPGQAASFDLREATLLTQDGTEVALVEDVIGDRIVVVDFIYTTCTTVCPVLSAVMMQVQGELGDRLGNDVVLVSISVDPLRDTPARLKDYAKKMRSGDGWLWLTGDRTAVDEVLRDFGAYTPNFEDHPAMVLVGDGATGEWSRFLGFPGSNHIVERVNEFAAARNTQSANKE